MANKLISPNWINENDACNWLGVNRTSLFRLRDSAGIDYTYLNGSRGLMYDKNDIDKILNENSNKTLTAKIGLKSNK